MLNRSARVFRNADVNCLLYQTLDISSSCIQLFT